MTTIKYLTLVFFLIAVLVNTSCARKNVQAPQPCRFALHGKVTDSMNGKKVKLIAYCYYPKSKIYKTYTTVAKGNKFNLTGLIDMPCAIANLLTFDANGDVTGNKRIVLEAKDDNQLVTPEVGQNDKFPKNKLSRATVINSTANYIKQLLDSVDSSAGNSSPIKIADEEIKVLTHYPNEYYSLLKLYQIAGEVGMTNEHEDLPLKVFHSFSPALQESALGQEFLSTTTISRNAAKLSKVGQQVQEFSVLTDSGKVFNTESLKGSPYVIGFSATWCIPCQEHQATLLTLYHKYRPQGLKVVYFNMDVNVKLWQDLIRNKKLDWINVSERTLVEESKLTKQFNIYEFPTYIVVNRKGKIVFNSENINPDSPQTPKLNDSYSHLEDYIKQAL